MGASMMLTTTEITAILVWLAAPTVGAAVWIAGAAIAVRKILRGQREANRLFHQSTAVAVRQFDEFRARILREDREHEHDEEGWQQ